MSLETCERARAEEARGLGGILGGTERRIGPLARRAPTDSRAGRLSCRTGWPPGQCGRVMDWAPARAESRLRRTGGPNPPLRARLRRSSRTPLVAGRDRSRQRDEGVPRDSGARGVQGDRRRGHGGLPARFGVELAAVHTEAAPAGVAPAFGAQFGSARGGRRTSSLALRKCPLGHLVRRGGRRRSPARDRRRGRCPCRG